MNKQESMEEKAARFVDMYVTEMICDGVNDDYIITMLLEYFTVDDLRKFGLANFIKNYMEG